MRLIVVLFFLAALNGFAQSGMRGTIRVKKGACIRSAQNEFVYEKVDSMPEFPGGNKNVDVWMRSNLIYPEEALKNGRSCKLLVKFIVLSDGTLTDITIPAEKNDVFYLEAFRLLTKMPKWKSGKCNGEKVDVAFTLPMNFSIK